MRSGVSFESGSRPPATTMGPEKRSPAGLGQGNGEKQEMDQLSITTLSREADRVNIKAIHAVARARCGSCGHRWPWPPNAPMLGESLFVTVKPPTAACPRCHAVGPLQPEPCDEGWWRYASRQPRRRDTLPSAARGPLRRQAVQPSPTTPAPKRQPPATAEQEVLRRVLAP